MRLSPTPKVSLLAKLSLQLLWAFQQLPEGIISSLLFSCRSHPSDPSSEEPSPAEKQWNTRLRTLKEQGSKPHRYWGESPVGTEKGKYKGPGVGLCLSVERHCVPGTECANRRGGRSRWYRTLQAITKPGFTLSEMERH